MKVEFFKSVDQWTWTVSFGNATAYGDYYSRRSDAVRGFERFCEAVRKGVQG